MAFTDNCDLYAAISEDGVNLIAEHVMTQRPSLFNYATQYVSAYPNLWCEAIPHTVDVTNHNNPLVSVYPAIPILGADSPPVGLDFCVQLVEAEVDFYPGNIITLPPELNPPLAPQHLAMMVHVCGGLSCPSDETISQIPVTQPGGRPGTVYEPPAEVVPPTRKLQCFCLDTFVIAHVEVQDVFGTPTLVAKVDGVHVADIEPKGLSENIDCYLRTTFAVLLKEKLAFPVSKMLFDTSLLNLANITATLTPNPPIPNNPAIEDDQLKLFINLQIQPPAGGGGGGGGGGGSQPSGVWTVPPVGAPHHVTIAASAQAFEQLFSVAEAAFSFSKSDSANFGPFSASYSIQLTLSGGNLQLNNDNTFEIQNVDVTLQKFDFNLCLDLPGFCIGGFCIVPDPWNGCLVSFPGFCIGGPICADIDLSGVVLQVTDLKANLVVKYFVDSARPSGITDVEAELQQHPNQWGVFINPTYVDVIIDVPATIDDIIVNAIENAINNSFPSWLPDWAKDLIWAFLGPIIDLIKDIIGIVGSIADWLENLFNTVFPLVPLIETAIADYFASQNPIYQFDDPFPILSSTTTLIPVKIPIRNLTAVVDSKEMIVRADVGAYDPNL